MFRMKSDGKPPSLPLIREEFESEEEINGIKCKSLVLGFCSVVHAELFLRRYKVSKMKWMEELRTFENLKEHIGPELGYAQTSLNI